MATYSHVKDLMESGHNGGLWGIGFDVYRGNDVVDGYLPTYDLVDGYTVFFCTTEREADELMSHYTTPSGVAELVALCPIEGGVLAGDRVEVQYEIGGIEGDSWWLDRSDWFECFVMQADGKTYR